MGNNEKNWISRAKGPRLDNAARGLQLENDVIVVAAVPEATQRRLIRKVGVVQWREHRHVTQWEKR